VRIYHAEPDIRMTDVYYDVDHGRDVRRHYLTMRRAGISEVEARRIVLDLVTCTATASPMGLRDLWSRLANAIAADEAEKAGGL